MTTLETLDCTLTHVYSEQNDMTERKEEHGVGEFPPMKARVMYRGVQGEKHWTVVAPCSEPRLKLGGGGSAGGSVRVPVKTAPAQEPASLLLAQPRILSQRLPAQLALGAALAGTATRRLALRPLHHL